MEKEKEGRTRRVLKGEREKSGRETELLNNVNILLYFIFGLVSLSADAII